MKRQDVFLIGCLMSALSFLYFESSSFDFQPVNSLSDPRIVKEHASKSLPAKSSSPALVESKVVEKEVAAVE